MKTRKGCDVENETYERRAVGWSLRAQSSWRAAGRSGSPAASPAGGKGKLEVVAAENFWGSIAAQLGGEKASVRSIVANPNSDPHSYEPTAQDARTLASARFVIVNGIGYDNWAPKLVEASPLGGRVVLNVGQTLGLKVGENPHQWYSPTHMRVVANQITTGLWPTRSSRRDVLRAAQARVSWSASWRAMTSCAGRSAPSTRVFRSATARASSNRSAKDLGLRLMTPYSFARGDRRGHPDVTAQDKQTVDAQASDLRDQGMGLQQPERDARRAARESDRARNAKSRSPRSPRPLAPRLGELRAVASRRARRPRRRPAASPPAGEAAMRAPTIEGVVAAPARIDVGRAGGAGPDQRRVPARRRPPRDPRTAGRAIVCALGGRDRATAEQPQSGRLAGERVSHHGGARAPSVCCSGSRSARAWFATSRSAAVPVTITTSSAISAAPGAVHRCRSRARDQPSHRSPAVARLRARDRASRRVPEMRRLTRCQSPLRFGGRVWLCGGGSSIKSCGTVTR